MKNNSTSLARGFSLIEVMVATVILAITLSSLLFTFRTANLAYETAITHGERQQLGRYAVNQVTNDLRNIFYKPESEYNVTRRQREAMQEQQMQQALQSGTQTPEDDETMADLGPAIDLSFSAEDGGDTDKLTLVRAHPKSSGAERPLWGLSRITYYVVDNALYRDVDDITKPETDEDGNEIPKPVPPRVDKIANYCTGFDLKFGYFFDEDWLLAEDWDSQAAVYRNPEDEDEEDDSTDPTQQGVTNVPGMAGLAQAAQQQQEGEKADDLPSWVELTFNFADAPPPDESSALANAATPKTQSYKQTIFIQNKHAQETYVPEQDDESEQATRAGERSGGTQQRGGNQKNREGRGRPSPRGDR